MSRPVRLDTQQKEVIMNTVDIKIAIDSLDAEDNPDSPLTLSAEVNGVPLDAILGTNPSDMLRELADAIEADDLECPGCEDDENAEHWRACPRWDAPENGAL